MGIMDFFRRNKKEKQKNNYDNRNVIDCRLEYSSGITADIKFTDLQELLLDNGATKTLQRVSVMYIMPNGEFITKPYYMEPVFDREGNNITKESYLQLVNNNKPLIKGFFSKEQIDNLSTNYIGYINYYQNGTPFRDKDDNFEVAYKVMQDRKREEQENKRRLADEQFKQELLSKVNNQGVHIKTCHAEYLGDKKYGKNYEKKPDGNCR